MEALQYYCDIINSEFENDTMSLWQQLDYFDGNVEALQALQTSCRSLDGRMDAIKAGMDAWDASLKKWEDSFLSGFPALKDVESKGGLGSCLYLIYDKNDNIVSSFIGSDNEFFTDRLEFLNITNTGICSFVHNKTFYAFDRNGTKLYEGTYAPSKEEWYHFTGTVTLIDGFYAPAPCGNILRKTTRDSFDSGKYEVLELVHPDGSAEDLISGYQLGVSAYGPAEYDYGYVANGVKNGWSWSTDSSSDFWKVSYFPLDSKDVLTRYIDMQTGDLYTTKEFQPIAEKTVFDGDDQYVAINDRYMLDNKTFDLVEIANPENVVANFSAGNGLHRLFYDAFNKLYWAVSGTGYYYVLDENFQQILDPRKPDNSWYILTPYGFVHASGDEYGLFDSKDNLLCSLPNGKAVGFVMSGEEYCVNMYTHKKICLQVTQ